MVHSEMTKFVPRQQVSAFQSVSLAAVEPGFGWEAVPMLSAQMEQTDEMTVETLGSPVPGHSCLPPLFLGMHSCSALPPKCA